MSRFTHAICDVCWRQQRGDDEPCRIRPEHAEEETCCYCGSKTRSGIYVRADPAATPCGGNHQEDSR